MVKKYDVAAYIWPAYTGDEKRTRMFWPEGMGEWQSVKNSIKKTPKHNWPRKPLWGYVNEADPYVMEMEINAALDHGVNVFIYDWYWYDQRPFLENCLNDGFLKARNHDRMKFYLMWANHHANAGWDYRISHMLDEAIIWQGTVDRNEFEVVGRRLIEMYFKHPAYYTIGGKPVFMIYDLPNLVNGLGGADATRDAIEKLPWVRKAAVRRQWPDGLSLVLEEHEAVARWRRLNGELALVNRQGEVFQADFPEGASALPQLSGPEGSALELLNRYAEFTGTVARIGRRIDRVALTPRLAWQIKLDDGVAIDLGRDQIRHPLGERLERFVTHYSALRQRVGTMRVADMRYPNGFVLRGIENAPAVAAGRKS